MPHQGDAQPLALATLVGCESPRPQSLAGNGSSFSGEPRAARNCKTIFFTAVPSAQQKGIFMEEKGQWTPDSRRQRTPERPSLDKADKA